MKRTPLRRFTPLRRKTRLAPISHKRIEEYRAYVDAVARCVASQGFNCQARRLWPEIACGGPLDCHHIAQRSTHPHLRLDPENFLMICRRHHDAVHDNPTTAKVLGLLL